MATLTQRRGEAAYINPYSKAGTIRGQQYRQGDFIWITDHDHANGGLLEQFAFKGLDEERGIVDVWVIEREKDGYVRNQTRSFRLDRVVTDTELRESKMAKATATKERVKAARTPKVGVCEYTGQETKGGRFRPGMDAALKGALLAAARGDNEDGSNGDVQAAAELIARNWPTKDVAKSVLAAGKKAIGTDADAFVEKRVKARLAKVARGTDPWEAASGLKAA